jgi:hypothetical protein
MELVVVVVGVLIALAAQQWAGERSSEKRAVAAEARIRAELQNNLLLGVERIALQGCLQERLATIAKGVSTGKSDWSDLVMVKSTEAPMAFSRLYRMPDRNWLTTEYDGSLTNGSLDSLSAERSELIASMYGQIRSQEANNQEELRLATELAALQFGPQLDHQGRIRLLSTLTRLDLLNSTMGLVARQQVETFRRLKYAERPQEVTEARRSNYWPNMVAEMRTKYGDCVDPNAMGVYDPRLLQ